LLRCSCSGGGGGGDRCAWGSRMAFARSAWNPSLRNSSVNARIVQVEVRNQDVQESFCSVYSVLDVFDVLRRGVSPSVGGLIVCALCN
jgi:hypothetical protein